MKIIENFDKRTHLSFIVKSKYKGVSVFIFVEASVNKNGIYEMFFRENGKKELLNPNLVIDKNEIEELIIKQLL
tara:strand:+ start:81 stop:302 length:222 start_codon:yes stop_codon:yes gene_type:complete